LLLLWCGALLQENVENRLFISVFHHFFIASFFFSRNSIDAIDDDEDEETSSIPSDEEGELVFFSSSCVLPTLISLVQVESHYSRSLLFPSMAGMRL
jgi:hypothetical protein